jgi:hypothetical protein
VFRLDYLSCCLTVLSTFLIGRKQWVGLVFGSINCVVICLIGMRTAQFGFVPANLFCLAIYSFSIRSWIRESKALTASHAAGESSALAYPPK